MTPKYTIGPNGALVPVGSGGGSGNVPTPQGGQGPYGAVPGATTNVDPAALWKTLYPNLSADVNAATGVVRSQLAGELTPEVQNRVIDAANARMVAGGVGGSPFAGAAIARDLGLTTMDLQNQGVGNLGNLLGTTYSNLVGPTTALAQDNAQLAAAPNPAQAAAEQQRIYQENQDRAFQQQQALVAQQFQQQMAYLDKYLSRASTVAGGGSSGSSLKPYGVTYTRYGAGGQLESQPYYSNIVYR